ncbi:MAG: protein kinase [Polyangiaceae bacterium]
MSETRDPAIGRVVLHRYRIVRLLAQGGMGAVYLARVEGAAGFAKPVVVKRILPHLSELLDEQTQFIREAQILSNLRHPGIVDVIDFGKEDGSYLMVLEYVHGYHLGQWLKYVARIGESIPWELCVHVAIQVLSALSYAHHFTKSDGKLATIVHRDVSPSNVLVDIEGNVRIVDFGIARMAAEQTSQELTAKGVFRGKFPYAAPELFSGEPATPAVDVYACAVVLFQLLAGHNPFSAAEPSVIMRKVISLVPPPLHTIREDVPERLSAVIAKALAKEPSERFPSAVDFAIALRAELKTPEVDLQNALREAVRRDFLGNLANSLRVQSLAELDEAWQKASGKFPVPSLAASLPTIRVTPGARGPNVAEPGTPAMAPVEHTVPKESQAPRSSLPWIVAGASGLIALGLVVAYVLRQPKPAESTHFLVVEANPQSVAAPASPSESHAAPLPVDSAIAPAAVASGSSNHSDKSRGAESTPKDPTIALTRTFAKRQSLIQSCFRNNTTSFSGAPELAIRFSIDASGRVLSASVRPDALNGTALGQCLVQVALGTAFGPQEKALKFSIPITARLQ